MRIRLINFCKKRDQIFRLCYKIFQSATFKMQNKKALMKLILVGGLMLSSHYLFYPSYNQMRIVNLSRMRIINLSRDKTTWPHNKTTCNQLMKLILVGGLMLSSYSISPSYKTQMRLVKLSMDKKTTCPHNKTTCNSIFHLQHIALMNQKPTRT